MSRKNLNIAASVTPTETPKEVIPLVVNIAKSVKDKAKTKLEELIKEETRMVKGIFQCFETPGSTTRIVVKKYKDVPMFSMEMTDGEIYEVPLYVARHLNGVDVSAGCLSEKKNPMIGTCSYPVHGFMYKGNEPNVSGTDSRGIPVPIIGVAKRVKRYGFQSMDFGVPIE